MFRLSFILLIFLTVTACAQQLAFPGAEGYGKYAAGGRGGKVYEVTNLSDAGAGSLRAAVEASGARTVVFRVSGTITLTKELKISKDSITIAGQTAPGDGICLKKYQFVVEANHVIVRYLRVRLGDETGLETDAMGGKKTGKKKIIIDHCSVSWSVDEALSPYCNDSLTVQWCLISESLYNSNHPKGAHGYGGIWGGNRNTYHHNLLAHHSSRNPRFASGAGLNDYRNNVVYNWGFNSTYGGERKDPADSLVYDFFQINMMANYYKAGPGTKSGVRSRICGPSSRNGAADCGQWYISDNYVQGNPTVTADNWNGGVQPDAGLTLAMLKADQPFNTMPIVQQTAAEAFISVLQKAGASLPKRDSLDERIVSETRNGTATYEGTTYRANQGFPVSAPTTGIIDSQKDVGGWPVLNSIPAPSDVDHDGMPDSWELSHGLDPNNAADRNLIGADGYTKLEEYLQSLIETLSDVRPQPGRPESFILEQNYPNPFNPSTMIRYSIDRSARVQLTVHDILGRKAAVLIDQIQAAGEHTFQFEAAGLASGIYFCLLRCGEKTLNRKMVLTR